MLALILGKPLIQRVYEQACQSKSLTRLIVATDDERILTACKKFGAEAWMTSSDHDSGTERVAEVAEKINSPIIINVQGDEPLIRGDVIDELVASLQDGTIPMATLAVRTRDLDLLSEPNTVKVVVDNENNALYFSRSPIPFQASDYFLQHIGVYGYQRDFLLEFCKFPPSRLEKAEKLEQLRILEHGHRIKVVESAHSTLSVDVPEDIIRVEHFLREHTHE
jgi:3-deoxy-manno-octulosonate cytidylyltransferase (CMP-KDO synthetase)